MEDKLRERLRLNMSIKLTMLPRYVKRLLAPVATAKRPRASEDGGGVITVIDETVDVMEKEKPHYRGW